MARTWRLGVCLYCYLCWLSAGSRCSPRSGARGRSEQPLGSRAAAGAAASALGAPLPAAGPGAAPVPPLLRVLRERGPRGWLGEAPRLQPDSRALRYMKRLYRLSATREGVPRAQRGRLYNTVRLFTPCWHCEGTGRNLFPFPGDVHSVDLLFSLDRVTALEHLLKSVLLYSFDTSIPISSSITCICRLSLKEHDYSSQVCPSTSHSLAFSLHFDVRKRKWVEMDVTAFLQPLIATNRRNVRMALNFTCLMGDPQGSTALEHAVNVTLVPPSLLLYLNDTSEQAYQRGSSLRHARRSGSPLAEPTRGDRGQGSPQGKRASRQRRNESPKAAPASSPHNLSEYLKQLAFPQHECELHNFRLSFSQLRWDRWIIAPHRYSPQFCRGDCPRALGHRYGSPVHTMVQTLIYERLDAAVPRPSCVPAAYSPLSVLTLEPDGSIAYKEYEDMIATKCTCR
ncbi:GDF9 factor, partial [Spelaeornis formosus]|nr:GDF9 factor [Elachura formosa]